MAGRTPSEAVDSFVAPLRHAVSCLTRSVLITDYRTTARAPHSVLFGGVEGARLRGRTDLTLDVALYFDVVDAEGDGGPWRCHTLGYSYEFVLPAGPSLLAFHFHPHVENVSYPHIHARQYTRPFDLSRTHIPSGRVPLEAVIRLAIDGFGVRPRRPDWAGILDESEAAWNRLRTW